MNPLRAVLDQIAQQKAENRAMFEENKRRARATAELVAEGQAFLARDPDDVSDAGKLIKEIFAFIDRVPPELVNSLRHRPTLIKLVADLSSHIERLHLIHYAPHSVGGQA